ncbi:MAG: PLDc N-terminal domain-containing protein [Oscillospiraceae bacterium]|nr:PLDc N-terminal domain-containing protein [Oscillospiraceae bacterium]
MTKTMILLLIPLILLQLILMIINLVNISKKAKTKYLNKTVWVIFILLLSYIGNVAYLLIEGGNDDSD